MLWASAQTSYPVAVLEDHPAAYWRMGAPPGSPFVADASGHSKSAAVEGPVYFGQIGALQESRNTAVDLAGEGYFATALFQRNTSEYSLEAWVKTFAIIAPIIQDRGYNDVNKSKSLSITMSIGQPEYSDGAVHCGVDGDNLYVRVITQLPVNDGKWHHLVCVFSGISGQVITPSQFEIYVDGVQQILNYASDSQPVAPVTGSDGTTIGIHPIWEQQFGMPRYVGTLDEVAIYEHALSAASVLAHYKAAKCPLRCK